MPTLRPGEIAILDNLQTHRGSELKLAIEAEGTLISRLTTRAWPDMERNPKLKAFLREVTTPSIDSL